MDCCAGGLVIGRFSLKERSMEDAVARKFIAEWISDWNNHDLDGILAHYSEDVVVSSPFAIKLAGASDGSVRGKAALRTYFSNALAAYPHLRFELVQMFVGVRSLAVHYRSVNGLLASETMIFNEADRVCHVFAHHAESTAAPEPGLNDIQRAAQEQFGRQSHRYGRGHILENVEDVRLAFEDMQLPECAQVLDVATGAGHTGLFFASLGHRVVLGDLAAPMLDRAREAAVQRGLVVTTQQHPAEAFPNPAASFDLVTCRVAPHHFSSPEKFIQETARVLKPGGWFLLIDGSIDDDQPEAEEWLHQVEKLRDPSHNRLLSPRKWSQLCELAGLAVQRVELLPFKQPDLNWYFETAATSPENRRKVLDLVVSIPESARKLFRLAEEDGKIVWWWPRLTLIARKP